MFRNLRSILAVATVLAAAGLGLTPPAASAEPSEAETAEAEAFPQLCLRTQVQTAKLRMLKFRRQGGTLSEVPYTDLAAFAASKPQVQPLTVTSYVTYDANLPKQVRCKGKSADHLTDVYGSAVAGPEGACADVNRVTLRQVSRSLTPEERKALVHRPNKVVIDPDTPAITGQDWLADFPVATKDAGGNLHLPSKSLLVPLDTPGIPDAFKGQHYCTLITPEYLKALLLGTVRP
ncbi:hypothetical protein [Nocardia sp. NPDC051832]|uniref:hypothetical protein n=1 Tax=Nocardia sp. NPDC051832 TaxID=3155673 RepID=UPI003422EFA1